MDKRLVLDSGHAPGDGCPSHSLGYYIGYIRNETACDQLTEEDLRETLQVRELLINKQAPHEELLGSQWNQP